MAKPSPASNTSPLLQTKNKGGRPTTFNEATAGIICERLADGETLTTICKTPGIPERTTVHRWRRKFPDFDNAYRQARADQQEAWGDECIDIADDDSLDTMETTDKAGNTVTVANHANVQRDRLRIGTRQFFMARLNRTYADKQEVTVSGSVQHTVDLSDRERMRRLASFMLEDRQSGVLVEGTAADLTSQASSLPATDDREPVSNESQSEEPADNE